jgi:hypothetical protein
MELRLKRFDMASLSNLSVVVAIGSASLAVLLVRDILSRQTDTPLGLVVSGTEVTASSSAWIHPQVFIHGTAARSWSRSSSDQTAIAVDRGGGGRKTVGHQSAGVCRSRRFGV